MRTVPRVVLFALLMVPAWSIGAPSAVGLGLPPIAGPKGNSATVGKIALGEKLFFDKRLSADGTVSCSSCHEPEMAFTDGKALAEGIGHRHGTRNAPTILNSAFNTTQFWDGRRPSLESQALDPLINPSEQGFASYAPLLERLRNDSEYVAAFKAAFEVKPGSIRIEYVGDALAAFERSLLSGNSPFDRYEYGGDKHALSDGARRGLELFRRSARCTSCHTIERGYALLTDNGFHSLNIGLKRIAPRLAELTTKLVNAKQAGKSLDQTVLSEEDLAELGRFVVTLKPSDIGKFRTPSLRNVALTAPYMHDGSVATLREAVEVELYNRGADAGRPLILTPAEKDDLVQFLEALTSPSTMSLKLLAPNRHNCSQIFLHSTYTDENY